MPDVATHTISIEQVQAAMQAAKLGGLPGPAAQATMAPSPRRPEPLPGAEPRQAGVLLILYPVDNELHTVLTLRQPNLTHHAGEVSLPGGGWEVGDATLQETALRETQEETGLDSDELELLGPLSPLYTTASNNTVHPFVAFLRRLPTFQPDRTEVATLLEVPLHALLDPKARREEDWIRRGAALHIPYYAVGGHKVWGVTAIVLAEFLALLSRSSSR